ncbi:hypothetical protein GCM10009665_38700 [Kitasatospora nipponensis]|uniref:Glucanase n=1 Tax=Kitasatospora nipponensis TaxID=258049 RepID=A0ABN1WBF2_9ACTN
MARRHLPRLRAATLVGAIGASLILPLSVATAAPVTAAPAPTVAAAAPAALATAATPEAHQDNPFAGATGYVNPLWKAQVESEAAAQQDPAVAARMRTVEGQPTSVWMDSIGAIAGPAGGMGLQAHLDAALAQRRAGTPEVFGLVVYDLPGRDCNALASNGELPATAAGLARYETQYIDPIAALLGQPKYAGLRIVATVEPDSLPNIVTNSAVTACQSAGPLYEQGVEYALNALHAIGNVYTYLDAGHAGWLGWPSNSTPAAAEFAKVAKATSAGFASVDGFATDTANTTPLREPFLTASTTVGGQQVIGAAAPNDFYQWNPDLDEATFTADLYRRLVAAGFPAGIGMVVDTSRNGWGGPNRPTAAGTGTDAGAFLNASRVDRRPHRGAWCNASGAGLGELPQATPAGYPDSHLDAFVWIKPPGESDGSSTAVANDQGKGFDRMCDPTYTPAGAGWNGRTTGALPNAPLAGQWFPAQFDQLVANAYPAVAAGTTGTSTCDPQGTISLAGGAYTLQANEWNSTATQCLTATSGTAWSVSTADFTLGGGGAPATYPSIYRGCHWGACTTGSSLPIQVNQLASATSSWSTVQPAAGAYDVAYDLWTNSTPTTTGQPDDSEIMVWQNSRGGVQPFGAKTGTATVAGHTWDVWTGQQSAWKIVSYVLQGGATSFADLDLKALVDDSVSRGVTAAGSYLIDAEAGFEIWQGGQGLATTTFSFDATRAGSGGDTTPPSVPTALAVTGTTATSASLSWAAAGDNVGVSGYTLYRDGVRVATVTGTSYTDTGLNPSTAYRYTVTASDAAGNTSAASTPVTATTGAGGGAPACAASWHLDSQWNPGFGATVTVTDTGTTATHGWTVTWTWPDGQQLTNSWNTVAQQSGQGVSAANLSYNGTLAPGTGTTFGVQGTWSGVNGTPTLACTAS